jgi:serine protease
MTPLLTRFALMKWLACWLALVGISPATADNSPGHLSSVFTQHTMAPAAIHIWGVESGPHQVVVAVVDSGVIADHPALQGRLLPGYDMQSRPHNTRGDRSSDFTPEPPNMRCNDVPVSNAYRTHGTEVASLIVGNGFGNVWGVNPGALVLPVRIMGPCPISRLDIIDAIAWAAGFEVPGVMLNPYPARVINLSFAGGGFSCDVRTQALIDRVVERGIFVVAAGGNNLRKQLQEPANCRGVVSVAAVNTEGYIEVYSALDARTALYAPAASPPLSVEGNWSANKLRVATEEFDLLGRPRLVGADRGIGTSFAAPVVSGLIALLLSHRPSTRPGDLVQNLEAFSRQIQVVAPPKCPCPGMALRLSEKKAVFQ